MKKKVIIVILLVMVLLAWLLISRFRGREVDIPRLVPDSAVLYLELKDAEGSWVRIAGSEFWQGLIASPLWEEAGIEEKIASFRRSLGPQAEFLLKRKNLMELIGEDLAVALISSGGKEGPLSLLLISRVSLKARAVEMLARLNGRGKAGSRQNLVEEEYAGRELVLIKPTDSFPFFAAYTFIDGYLAAVISQYPASPTLQRVVDLAEGAEGLLPLADDPGYRRAEESGSFSASAPVAWYLRLDRLVRLGKKGILPFVFSGYPSPAVDELKFKEAVSGIFPAFRAAAGQIGFDGGLRSRLYLEAKKPEVGEESGKPAFPEYIPSGPLLYLSLRSDLAALWEKYLKLEESFTPAAGGGGLMADLRGWERESGLKVADDLLPWMGGKVAFLLEGINIGLFPLPELACVFEVKDRRKAAEALEKLTEWLVRDRQLPVMKEKYAGREVVLFSNPLILQPGYSLSDDLLIVSSSQSLLLKMIDAARGEGPSLAADPDFKKTTAKTGASGEVLLYLDSEKLIDESMETADWLLPMQKIMSADPWLPEELYLEKIAPFLELCRVFKTLAVNIDHRDGVVIQDAYCYINGAPAPIEEE